MLASESDNLVRWNGKEKPFYEVYYLKVNDPSLGVALWLRYTFTSFIDKAPVAEVWGVFKNLSLKNSFSVREINFRKSNFYLNFNGSVLNNSGSAGEIKQNGSVISWDIAWEPTQKSFRHYPALLYFLPWPKSKVVAPNIAVKANGTFVINGVKYYLHNSPLYQGHIWGKNYSKKWAWANCGCFREDKDAVLELLMRLPFGLGYLKAFGREHRFSFRDPYSFSEWNFKYGKIVAKRENMVEVVYENPSGGKRYCYNTKVADALITIEGRKLTSTGTTAFEVVESESVI